MPRQRPTIETLLARRYEPARQPGRLATALGKIVLGPNYQTDRTDRAELPFWHAVIGHIKIDGKVHDSEWITRRDAELRAALGTSSAYSPKGLWAHGRARLEDYHRHQRPLPDGRVAAQLPAFGVKRSDLLNLGLEVDIFDHGAIKQDNESMYTVILPHGWSLQIAGESGEDPAETMQILNSERSGWVLNEQGQPAIEVHYIYKPFPYEDGIRTWSWLASPPPESNETSG